MQEYVSDAIVLAKYPLGELDGRYSLFTEKYGKMTGKTKSSRKITSKLAPHLEPGNAVKVRFVEKGGMQIVDALKVGRTGIALGDLASCAALLPEMDPDSGLWDAIGHQPFSWRNVLRILGWDPEGADCAACGKRAMSFYIPKQDFYCAACSLRMKKNDLITFSV